MFSCNLIFLTIYTLVFQSRPLTGFIKDDVLTAVLVIVINLISTILNSQLSMLVSVISVSMRYE